MRMLSPRLVPHVVLAACVAALTSALIAQYGLGLKPCVLCITQRVPFAVAGVLAAVVLVARLGGGWRRAVMALAGLAFAVNAGIAFYHVGVERKWWQSSCAQDDAAPLAVNDLAALMVKPAEARCDEPAWSWHGVTMAGLNIFYSAGLAALTLAAVRRREERQ